MKKITLSIFITTVFINIQLKAQVQLYGLCQNGGANYAGTLFKYDVANDTIMVKHNFDSTGAYPTGKLLYATNGKLYGATKSGAAFGSGSIFEYDPISEITTVKASFDAATTGGSLSGKIIQLSNGDIAGICATGGANYFGTIWKYSIANDTIIKLFDFNDSTGSPSLGLFQASNGKLYGSTFSLSSTEFRKFFEFDLNTNTLNVIKEFNSFDNTGVNMVEVDGKLFGTFWWTGSTGIGNIFEYDLKTHIYTERSCFQYGADTNHSIGATPITGLSLGVDGMLYGTTSNGGNGQGLMFPKNGGTLFRFDPGTGDIMKLHDFDYNIDGDASNPPMQASDLNIYGMTYIGNSSLSTGSIYRFALFTGYVDTLRSFNITTGTNPQWTEFTEIPPSNPVCDSLKISKITSNVTCYGGSDGAIDITVSGATSNNYSFEWWGNATTEDMDSLKAGLYNVKVTVNDLNGCQKAENIRIFQPNIGTKNVTKDLVNGITTITVADIFDDQFGSCGIDSMTVSQTVFTCDNIGSNIVMLFATDSLGNTITKPAMVTINGVPKSSTYISTSAQPEYCQKGEITLVANTYDIEGQTDGIHYLWSNTDTTQSINANTPGIYDVTFTFQNGCSIKDTFSYEIKKLVSSYTIIGSQEVKLNNYSTVKSGGVGATWTGEIRVENHSSIKGATTFADAFKVVVKSGSTVTNKYSGTYADVSSVITPYFLYNPTCYDSQNHKNIHVKKNRIVTLTDSIFGSIYIESGATVTFTTAFVYADSIKTDSAVQIKFSKCSQVALCGNMILGENNMFNVDNKLVIVNSPANISIAQGSTWFGSVNSYGTLTTLGSSTAKNNLTGMFVAANVYSEYSNFSQDTLCGCDSTVIPILQPVGVNEVGSENSTVNVYPNPANGNFNLTINSALSGAISISVTSIAGQLLFQTKTENTSGAFQIPINLSDYSNGIYFLKVQIGGELVTKKLIVNK